MTRDREKVATVRGKHYGLMLISAAILAGCTASESIRYGGVGARYAPACGLAAVCQPYYSPRLFMYPDDPGGLYLYSRRVPYAYYSYDYYYLNPFWDRYIYRHAPRPVYRPPPRRRDPPRHDDPVVTRPPVTQPPETRPPPDRPRPPVADRDDRPPRLKARSRLQDHRR